MEKEKNTGLLHLAKLVGEYALLGLQEMLIKVDDNIQELPE